MTTTADPFKLSRYAHDGMQLAGTLKSKATTLTNALNALRNSGSVYVPSLGEGDATLKDLGEDWYHLDEFAGDVAHAFFAADQFLGERHRGGPVIRSLSDDSIRRLGQVGFADRDEAIRAANELAGTIERLRDDDDVSDEDIERIVAQATRGQYDPAFAVSLVERLGVDGMVDVVGIIEEGMYGEPERWGGEWGLQRIKPFSTIMTTALDTLPSTDVADRHDIDNQNLADSERLDASFVRDLTTDWDGEMGEGLSLSILMRQADPPTQVTVDLANNRFSPLLRRAPYEPQGDPRLWGEGAGMATNYAEMLSRNDDASAQWLTMKPNVQPPDGAGSNMERALHNHDMFLDHGEAIARVVENGVTHIDDDLRRTNMTNAIDIVGGEMDEIRLDPMYDALAAGVEQNMDLIAERATATSLGSEGGQATTIHNTHDFLRELMGNDEAAARVYSATLDFVHDGLHSAGPGENLGFETTRIGAVTSLVTEADINAEVGEAEERAARREAFLGGFGQVVDSTIGLLPGGGTVSSLGQDALGWGADQLLEQFQDTEGVDQALENGTHYRRATQELISAALANHQYAVGDLTSAQVIEAATQTGSPADSDFFVDGTEGAKRPIKPLNEMSDSERAAYNRWLTSEQMADRITDDRTNAGQASDDVQELVEGRT